MVRWYLLGIGLPTGLMIGFGLAVNGSQTSWLDFAVTVTVTTVAMASVVGGSVELYVKYVPRSRPSCWPCPGCLGGYSGGWDRRLLRSGSNSSWTLGAVARPP
jgi:hypothetical protein